MARPNSCPTCNDVLFPFDAVGPGGERIAGYFCKTDGSHTISYLPAPYSFGNFLEQDRAKWLVFPSAIILIALMLYLIIFPFTEGKATYCYVNASVNHTGYCLSGHEDWRTDRLFRCGFKDPAEGIEFAKSLQCPLEFETKK